MHLDHSVAIAAPPARIFALYAAAADWPLWDRELRAAALPEGLHRGTRGWLQPQSGPRVAFRVTEVAADAGFTVTAHLPHPALPLCTLTFGHTLTPEGPATIARHWVRFSGPLAGVFRRLLGPGLHKGVPISLAGLKSAAEA